MVLLMLLRLVSRIQEICSANYISQIFERLAIIYIQRLALSLIDRDDAGSSSEGARDRIEFCDHDAPSENGFHRP